MTGRPSNLTPETQKRICHRENHRQTAESAGL
jgi:hypothetical protein